MTTPGNLSEQVVAAPGGAGGVRSAGETFQANPYTGTGGYRIPIELMPGPAGISPALALAYSTHGGNGAAGQGWSLGLAEVSRRTDKGLPTFDDATDTFTLQGDELIPTGGDTYRLRIESRFARVRYITGRGRSVWVVTERDGTRTFYGETPQSRVSDGSGRIASWKVTRKQDVHGNEVRYHYARDAQTREVQLVQVTWGGCYRVQVQWQVRPDPIRSARMGFPVEYGHRVSALSVEVVRSDTQAWQEVRRYDLTYTVSRWTGRSLLTNVAVTGTDADGGTRTLPPVTLAYGDPSLQERRWHDVGGDVPGGSLGTANLTFVRQSGGGLPDVLEARQTGYVLRTNLGGGQLAPARRVASPALVMLSDAGTFLSDMSGDGWVDLIEAGGKRVYKRAVNGGFSEPYPAVARPTVDLTDPTVKVADLTGNGVPDALRAGPSGWWFFENLGEGSWASPVRVLRPPPVRLDDPRVHLVDIDGDGMPDLVYVSDQGIEVWPGLGRGSFGAKRRLHNAPRIEARIDPAAIRWMDLTGSGQSDLLYVKSGSVWVCTNQAGRALSDPVQVSSVRQSSMGHVEPVDLLGTSADGLLFTDGASGGPHWRFLELFPDGPPDLLATIGNGMGTTTTLTYGSSAAHWARDRAAARPWQTAMPSPQRVVDEVLTHDTVSGLSLGVRYLYHHGVYDGVEREFRGFAMVEQLDREAERGDPQPLAQARTARWYHTGADVSLYAEWTAHRKGVVDDQIPPLPWARRSLRGQVRREEVFAMDGEALPYQITHTSYRVFPVGRRRHAHEGSFAPLPVHQRQVYLERQRDDRVVDSATTYDLHTGAGYGLPTEVRQTAHGRLGSFSTAWEQQQTESYERYTTTTYVHLDGPDDSEPADAYTPVYIVGKPSVVEAYGVTGSGDVLLSKTRTFYDGTDNLGLGHPSTASELGVTKGLVSSVLELCFTTAEFTATYPGGSGAATARSDRGNYVQDGTEWYRHAQRATYADNGQMATQTDANGNVNTVTYDDDWDLFPIEVVDAADHPTTLERGELPHQLIALVDANGNRSEFTYDPSGLPESKSVMGVESSPGLGDWSGDPPSHPTEQYSYDFDSLPISTTTKTRQVRLGATVDVVRYVDGLGQVLQERHTAEEDPGSPGARFRVTGWQVRNHKGLVVTAYQPTFASTDAYSSGDQTTAAVHTTYDPLGRPVRVDHPDGTYETTSYHPWVQAHWDRNDTAAHIGLADTRYGDHLDRFTDHLSTPTRTYVDALGRDIAVAEDAGDETSVASTLRSTTYQLDDGEFSAANYDLTLSHPLSSNYFVLIAARESGSAGVRADNVGVRVSRDPFGSGDLIASGADNQIRLTRGSSSEGDWQGSITVVECLGDPAASGFTLVDVTEVAASSDTSGSTQSVAATANTAWSDLGQVAVYGGPRGGGGTASSSDASRMTSLHGTWVPSGTDTVTLTRHGGGVDLSAATFSAYVVQWGSEHTIERVTVSGSNGGAGVDVAAEYNTATIASTNRAQTWLWMSGYTETAGHRSSFTGLVLALGDGETQSATETEVAVGCEVSVTKEVLVTVHSHASVAVDHLFEGTGNSSVDALNHTVDALDEPLDETYDDAGPLKVTEGARVGLQTNTADSTGTDYGQALWGVRHTGDTTLRVTRATTGDAWAAWLQSVDFSAVQHTLPKLHVTRSVVDLKDQVVEVHDARDLGTATWEFTYDQAGRRVVTNHTTGVGVRHALADAGDNPIWSRDARTIESDRTFDALNRPLTEDSDDGTTVKRRRQWTYVAYDDTGPDHATHQSKNLYGQLEESRDADGVRFFEYDHRGLVTKVSHKFWDLDWSNASSGVWDDGGGGAIGAGFDPAVSSLARSDGSLSWLTLTHLNSGSGTDTVVMTTTYDAAGRPLVVDYPESSKVRRTYNVAGALDTVEVDRGTGSGWQSVIDNLEYNARGQLTHLEHGNGVDTDWTYDADIERLLRLQTTQTSTSTKLQDLAYVYDPVGNPVELTDALTNPGWSASLPVPNTREFHYDARYRLVRATGRKLKTTAAKTINPYEPTPAANEYEAYDYRYAYDPVGNFTKNHEYSRGQLHYKASGRIDLFNGDGSEALDDAPAAGNFRYDANGNTTRTPRHLQLAYTHDNQVRYVDKGGNTEVRDLRHGDQRVLRLVKKNGVRALGVYLGPWEYHERVGTGAFTKTVLHVSGHGRHAQAEVVLDGTDSSSPDLFFVHGDHLGSGHVLTKDDGTLLSQEEYFPYGRASDRRDARNRYRYIGVERDEDTGLSMTGPRTYDPVSGRFLQGDPLASTMFPGKSPFGYASGNPVAFLDRDGMAPVPHAAMRDRPDLPGYPGGTTVRAAGEFRTDAMQTGSYSQSSEAVPAGGVGFNVQVYEDRVVVTAQMRIMESDLSAASNAGLEAAMRSDVSNAWDGKFEAVVDGQALPVRFSLDIVEANLDSFRATGEVGARVTDGPASISRLPSPEAISADPGVAAHEFGHYLGLADEYGIGDDDWEAATGRPASERPTESSIMGARTESGGFGEPQLRHMEHVADTMSAALPESSIQIRASTQ